jgi:hypothetical protein
MSPKTLLRTLGIRPDRLASLVLGRREDITLHVMAAEMIDPLFADG